LLLITGQVLFSFGQEKWIQLIRWTSRQESYWRGRPWLIYSLLNWNSWQHSYPHLLITHMLFHKQNLMTHTFLDRLKLMIPVLLDKQTHEAYRFAVSTDQDVWLIFPTDYNFQQTKTTIQTKTLDSRICILR